MVRNSDTAPQTFSTVKEFFAEETINETESDSNNDSEENTESFHSVETDPNQTCYSLRTKSTVSSGRIKHRSKENKQPSSLALNNDLSNSKLITGKQNMKTSETQQSLNNTKKSDNRTMNTNKPLKVIKRNLKSKVNVSEPKEILKEIIPPNQIRSKRLSSIIENTDIPHNARTELDKTVQSAREASSPERNRVSEPKKSKTTEPRRKQKNPKGRGMQALAVVNDIIKQQNRTDLIVPKLPFSRVIKEILSTYAYNGNYLRVSAEALQALQESAEMFLTQFFQDAYLCTIHRGRITLMVKDMQLAQTLRKL